MLLKSIEIQGFKSFADKTVLRFGQGLTAVVGPNGSGKSNISDAVRWVLGEQSTKNLRGQAMEDVIFNGTASHKAGGYAEVTLNIDNTDRSLKFDDDTVSVTRRYYRSHESEYLINRVSVRLKDVHELFMDTGLGRDGYSMVGQGKIDSIVHSRSGERRDIFEEASGISRYRYRKIEAERKLEAAEENLVRLRDIMGELESRVGPLKEQSEKAQKFLVLAEDKKKLEIGLWLYSLNASGDALKRHEQKLTIAKANYAEIERELARIEAETETGSESVNEMTVKIDEIHRSISANEEDIIRIEGEQAVIRNTIENEERQIERLSAEIAELSGSGDADSLEIKNREALIDEKNSYLQALKAEAEAVNAQLTGLITDSENISRQIEEKVKMLNRLSLEQSECTVEQVTAKSSVSELSDRCNTLEADLAQKAEDTARLQKEWDEYKGDLDILDQKETECRNTIDGYEMRYNSRKETADKAKEKVETLKSDIEGKLHRAGILEDLEKSMEGFTYSVKEVMKWSDAGTLRGIHGPVSRLIKVPNKYGVAIETALGANLQHIVVETEADAKRAINMLKNSDKGRATFLPVSSVKGKGIEEKGVEDCFGFVGFATELIEYDKKYHEIMMSLIGKTVVAEDIDAAVAISKKYGYKFKTVTLDGQVVNAGGSLTGGSLVKNAGLLSRKSTIKQLKDQAEKQQEQLERAKIELEMAVSSAAEAEAQVVSVKSELQTVNEDRIRVLAKIKRVEEMKNSADTAMKEVESELSNAKERIEKLTLSAQGASQRFEAIEKEKTAVEREIDEMSGGRENANIERQEISNRLTEFKLKIIETEKDLESLVAAAQMLQASAEMREERIKALQAQIAAEQAEIDANSGKITEAEAAVGVLRALSLERKQTAMRLTKERDDITLRSGELRRSEREKLSEKEIVAGEVARLTERGEAMLREYDEMTARMFDEYGLTRNEAEAVSGPCEKPTEARKELSEVKGKIKALGSVNVGAIEEYKEVGQRYEFMSAQISDVEKSRAELYKLIGTLTDTMKDMFMEGFNKINDNFKTIFTSLFGGGSAELVLTEPENILQSGIDIKAKLPGKNVPSLDGLSGGEKALVAIAIYFSAMKVNAPAFCILDEIDTALDEANVNLVAEYIKNSGIPTQFICITHRRGTMEASDMLYGVTMQEQGISKLLELNMAELERKLLGVVK